MTSTGTQTVVDAPEPAPSGGPFEAFRIPAFRHLWGNTLLFMLVQSTQRFTFVWLVLELGHDAGSADVALGVPVLFIAMPAGALADRMDRRNLMAIPRTDDGRPVPGLLAAVARDELTADAFEASMLFASLGAGLLAGSMYLAVRRDLPRKGLVLAGTVASGGLVRVGMGLSRWYAVTVVAMLLWGLCGGFFMNLSQSLIQSSWRCGRPRSGALS